MSCSLPQPAARSLRSRFHWKSVGTTCCLLAVGYVLGSTDLLQLSSSQAQPGLKVQEDDAEITIDIANDAVRQIQRIHESLQSAMETLRIEGHYNPATEGVNPYLVLTGGGDAIDDLERGTGVDPVTFAALYAGKAVREVQDELSRDESGRLMYKKNLIRIYSVDRLKQKAEKAQAVLEKRLLP